MGQGAGAELFGQGIPSRFGPPLVSNITLSKLHKQIADFALTHICTERERERRFRREKQVYSPTVEERETTPKLKGERLCFFLGERERERERERGLCNASEEIRSSDHIARNDSEIEERESGSSPEIRKKSIEREILGILHM